LIEDEICISVLIGGAFEQLIYPEGREFKQANQSSKVQLPGGSVEASI